MPDSEWKKPNWQIELVAEFAAKGSITYHDVVRVCGNQFRNNTWFQLRDAGFQVEQTGLKDFSQPNHPRFYRMIAVPSWMSERIKGSGFPEPGGVVRVKDLPFTTEIAELSPEKSYVFRVSKDIPIEEMRKLAERLHDAGIKGVIINDDVEISEII